MPTTTGTFVFYESFAKSGHEGMNLGSDTLKVLLTTSSYTPAAATHETLSDITNEVSGSGYARQTLGTVTHTETGGVATLDSADVEFTASGGSITARYWVLYNDTSSSDELIAYGLLDNTPADVVTADGDTLTVAPNASGWFTNTAN